MKRSDMLKAGVQFVVCTALVLSVGVGSALAKGKLGGSKEETKGDYVWTIDADCTQCHEKQAKSMEDETLLANKHASLECTFCHNYQVTEEEAAAEATDAEATEAIADEDAPETLEEAHATVDTVEVVKKNALRDTVVPEEACLTCHDRDTLIEATKDCDTLTDANGTVVNPHELIEGEQHESITCANCHMMHSSDSAAAYRACVSCHHAEVWECGTCHTYNADVNAE